jgi:hypothetical protein
MGTLKEYDAKMDAKHRLTIRGAKYEHYHVKEYADGRIELEPRVLVNPFEISKRTLSAMDQSMKNFEKGSVSDPLDLSEFAE